MARLKGSNPPGPAAPVCRPDQGRGRCQQYGDQRQPIGAGHRGELHQLIGAGQRVADEVERKAREQVAARPLGKRQTNREGDDPEPALGPDQVRQRAPQSPEHGEDGGQPHDAERHQHEEDAALLDEGRPQPVQRRAEIAEPEAKPDPEGRPEDTAHQRPLPFRPVERPDPYRQGKEQRGEEEERRRRGRGNGPRDNQDQETPPAMAQHHGFGQPGHSALESGGMALGCGVAAIGQARQCGRPLATVPSG